MSWVTGVKNMGVAFQALDSTVEVSSAQGHGKLRGK